MVLPFTYSAPHPFCCSSCQLSLHEQIFFLKWQSEQGKRISSYFPLFSATHLFLAYHHKINSQILLLWLQQVHMLVLVVCAS